MGVDGINGPGGSGIPEPPAQDGASPGEFSVTGPSGTASSGVAASGAAAAASSELDRVASGELSVEQYLDARVERATSHLVGALPAEQLQDLKEVLREQLATDPVLVHLVSRVLGTDASEPGR